MNTLSLQGRLTYNIVFTSTDTTVRDSNKTMINIFHFAVTNMTTTLGFLLTIKVKMSTITWQYGCDNYHLTLH